MGKEHLIFLLEINRKSYTRSITRYFFEKHWHDPNNYKKRKVKTYLIRRHQSKVETPIRGKTTYGERPDLSGIPSTCYVHRFGGKPPYDFLKSKDLVEVLFTDKWFKFVPNEEPSDRGASFSPSLIENHVQQVGLFKELQKGSGNYLDTFLEPYILTHPEYIRDYIDDLCDVDVLFQPFALMGKKDSGRWWSDIEKTELEAYVIKTYKSRKNVIPYKENLVHCFQSKLKMISRKHDILEEYKKDKRKVWFRLDDIVRSFRIIEKYLQDNGIEPVYFNLDRDNYKDTFGIEKDELPLTQTDFGDYSERKQFEQIAKEYITEREMKDMRI